MRGWGDRVKLVGRRSPKIEGEHRWELPGKRAREIQCGAALIKSMNSM